MVQGIYIIMRQATSDNIRRDKRGNWLDELPFQRSLPFKPRIIRFIHHIGIVPKILTRGIMVAAFMLMVTLADPIRKHDNTFLIDISDKASASTAVRAGCLAPVTVFLKMKTILTHIRSDFCRLHPALLHFAVFVPPIH